MINLSMGDGEKMEWNNTNWTDEEAKERGANFSFGEPSEAFCRACSFNPFAESETEPKAREGLKWSRLVSEGRLWEKFALNAGMKGGAI